MIIKIMLISIFLLLSSLFSSASIVETKDNNFNDKTLEIKNIFSGFLSGLVHTNCDGIEKTSEIKFGIYNYIDVDDNKSTGQNGADIKVQYLLLPWIEIDLQFRFGVIFTIRVERLSDELKNKNFSITVELFNNITRLGYKCSAEEGNEVPNNTRLSFIIFFSIYEKTHGFIIDFIPNYENSNENKKIQTFAEYNGNTIKSKISLDFDPAVKTQTKITSTKDENIWNYEFIKSSLSTTKLTTNFTILKKDDTKNIVFSIDELPTEISFKLGLKPFSGEGGYFLYESEQSFDIKLSIYNNKLGKCKYVTIKNTPKRISSEWIPTRINGSYSVEIESEGTDLSITDSNIDPTINLSIKNLKTVDIKAHWNLTNPGDFTIIKDTDLTINLDLKIGNWLAQISSEPLADYISVNWLIGEQGYVRTNTDWKILGTMDLLIKSTDSRLKITGENIRTLDFLITWTGPWPWNVETFGAIDYSAVSFDIYRDGAWRHLWPLI